MTTYLFENFLGFSLPMSEQQEVPPIADGPALGSFNAFLPNRGKLLSCINDLNSLLISKIDKG
ncbi:hypothetical protein CYANOKiyG1_68670 [Okeania sp. KiyG1]|nr:hypothetical protein CYANOKiyG1_68670 [Okeania sp. KiyG1]